MPSPFTTFHRYWQEWEAKLKLPIERNAAKLLFTALGERRRDDGDYELFLQHPICIANAPQKAASHRGGPSHRNTLLIHGGFIVRVGTEAPYLVQGRCSLSLFSVTNGEGGALTLHEIDAMHFDMERTDSPTPFHPTFHVQRDTDNGLGDGAVRQAVAAITHADPARISLERSGGLGTQHLRLPTPQMDVFAVLTAVIADFFCNGGDKDPKIKAQFRAILEWLRHPSNVAYEGFAARALAVRTAGSVGCPAPWYPEFA